MKNPFQELSASKAEKLIESANGEIENWWTIKDSEKNKFNSQKKFLKRQYYSSREIIKQRFYS